MKKDRLIPVGFSLVLGIYWPALLLTIRNNEFLNSNWLTNNLKIFNKDKKYLTEAEIIKERLPEYS